MDKRTVKDMEAMREKFYEYIGEHAEEIGAAIGVKVIGRAVEGIVFENMETGFAEVIRVIAKQADYDAEDAIEEYEEKKAAKAAKAKEKAAKAEKAKATKAAKEKDEVEGQTQLSPFPP